MQGLERSLAAAFVLGTLLIGQRSLAGSAGDAAGAPPPLAVYGQLPTLEDPAISPAGDRLAYLARQDDQRYVALIDLTTGKPVAAARVDDTKVRALIWYDDSRLLIVYSTTSYPPFDTIGQRQEWYMLAVWDLAAKRIRPIDLHDDDYETMNVVTGADRLADG